VNEYAEVSLAALAEDKYGEQNGREEGAVEDEGWREVSGSPSRTATTTIGSSDQDPGGSHTLLIRS
jgi:hypothetical protein